MALYFDEIWLGWTDAAGAQRALSIVSGMDSPSFPYPEGVRLVAGPWFSNEEAKVLLVLDIADHAKTFAAFGLALLHGFITRRRLTPIVEWSAMQELLRTAAPGGG